MNKFALKSSYTPIPAQLSAINQLVDNYKNNEKYQVLLGVTGSGKTYTVANVIEKLQKPALIISHNKTLAGQLYQEFRDFFPDNAVSYFVSYYDYYQPEAYIPSTDTYIEKDASINELIDKLRLEATTNLLTRKDTIVVASVSCIYNIGSPKEYKKFIFEFSEGMKMQRDQAISRLIDLQYERSEFGFHRGTFRVRGENIDIYPAYLDFGVRITIENDKIANVIFLDTVTGEVVNKKENNGSFSLYPSKHFITDPTKSDDVYKQIDEDLQKRIKELTKQGKNLEVHRLKQKVTYDMQMLKELGYVKGIENYSRYFDGRNPGDAPFSLLDFFNEPFLKDWLVFVDESHITFPQIRGMYFGDKSRKQTLIDYGFRLPASIDNRPLTFDEFMKKVPGFIAVSATPSEWEMSMSSDKAKVQQLIRPTGIPDPLVEIRPLNTQVLDVIKEIKKETERGFRSLITTLTKKTAEDLSSYLQEQGINVQYLHSDVKTLERSDTLDNLRRGKYDCIVGVNLLREGLDLPEVSLVAILDADKEGFLRSEVSLTQTMGRAARHVEGRVVLYADRITGSMQRALDEIKRRREYQIKYNLEHNITPTSIQKPLREKLIDFSDGDNPDLFTRNVSNLFLTLEDIDIPSLTPLDKKRLANKLRKEMKIAAVEMNFELAAEIRDKIREIEK